MLSVRARPSVPNFKRKFMDRRILRDILKKEESKASGLQDYLEDVTKDKNTLEEVLQYRSEEMFRQMFDEYLEAKMKIDLIKKDDP